MKTFLAMVVLALVASQAVAQESNPASQSVADSSVKTQTAMTYTKAYQKAQSGDKPLLVMVTAKWCPPCQLMKQNTMPELFNKDAFRDFHFATVDYDAETKIADQLIGDRGLPQMIMFEKSNGKWLRRYLKGIQTAQAVEAFVAQAGTYRTADAKANRIEK
jgi:thioredoxin-like negative regulator of GroEL